MNKVKRAILLIGLFLMIISYVFIKKTFLDELPLNANIVSFRVYENESLQTISLRLEQESIIKSARMLRLYLSWKHFDTKLLQGEFLFISPINLRDVAERLVQKPNKPLITVTIPEGYTDEQIVNLFVKKNPKLQKEKLLASIQSRNASGYLFPDTYFLSGTEKEDQIIERMISHFRDTYVTHFLPGQKHEVEEILSDTIIHRHLIIASILEGEANTEYDRRVIAGMLLQREKLHMRLQVDVAKETYIKQGFPETPINNPGLVSLSSVQNPITTKYLYYLTGTDGKMHYAVTFKEHRKNILTYLK